MKKGFKLLPLLGLLFLVSCGAPKTYEEGITKMQEDGWQIMGSSAFKMIDGVLISVRIEFYEDQNEAKERSERSPDNSESVGHWVIYGQDSFRSKAKRSLTK